MKESEVLSALLLSESLASHSNVTEGSGCDVLDE
jgi:hypothetical protein